MHSHPTPSARIAALNRASTTKRFDAYADVAWDELGAIEDDDPRWERHEDDPLGRTEWYRSLPDPLRAKLGLHLTIAQLRLGIDFEGVLARGLLELTSTLDVRDEAFRYAYHEVIEEAHHTLMFRELIVRSGLFARGLRGLERWHSRQVPSIARTFPELFFVFVLGGEAPIDYVQRRMLRSPHEQHPLLTRVVRIHVTEEARHLAFAEVLLRERVPRLGALQRSILALRAPFVLRAMADQMLMPPREVVCEHGIPRRVIREAYGRDATFRAERAASVSRVRALFEDLGLLGPRARWLWRMLGLMPAHPMLAAPAAAAR